MCLNTTISKITGHPVLQNMFSKVLKGFHEYNINYATRGSPERESLPYSYHY